MRAAADVAIKHNIGAGLVAQVTRGLHTVFTLCSYVLAGVQRGFDLFQSAQMGGVHYKPNYTSATGIAVREKVSAELQKSMDSRMCGLYRLRTEIDSSLFIGPEFISSLGECMIKMLQIPCVSPDVSSMIVLFPKSRNICKRFVIYTKFAIFWIFHILFDCVKATI